MVSGPAAPTSPGAFYKCRVSGLTPKQNLYFSKIPRWRGFTLDFEKSCDNFVSNAIRVSPGGSDGEESAEMQEMWVWSLGWEDPLEEVATHSSILAWSIPWTEELGGLQSMGSQRARHNWVTNTASSQKCHKGLKDGEGSAFPTIKRTSVWSDLSLAPIVMISEEDVLIGT